MKKFVKKIVLFCVPVILWMLFIFYMTPNREFCFNYIQGDCEGRGKLIYERIYEDTRKIDYLFVGSSKTWNNINDELLEGLIAKPNEFQVKLYNTGYCRFGRNLDYLFCKEFLKCHHLKKIFLEVRADESTNSHPMFPYLADGSEVIEGFKALNLSVFPEIYKHLLMNLNYFRGTIQLDSIGRILAHPVQYGYNNIEKTISEKELNEYYEKEKEKTISVKPGSFKYRFSNYYLNKIKTLCDSKGIELVLVYLPSYANLTKNPLFLTEYQKLGKVILVSDSIFNNKTYWKDVAHFNSFGANAYTKYLATQLSR